MTNIIGLDVGRGYAVAAALTGFPENPKRYFAAHRKDFAKLKCNPAGLEALKAMQADAIVMEPTGGWYSSIWNEMANYLQVPVYYVGHGDLSYQRGSYGFKNKRDPEDAFSLACTYFDNRFVNSHGEKRWLRFNEGAIADLKRLFYELEQLDKVRNSLINQTRQRLAYEFPEAVKRRANVNKDGFSPFWAWLAGDYQNGKARVDYEKSIAHELGIEISDYTRLHANRIISIEQQQDELIKKTKLLMQLPEFTNYLKVFRRFGFGFKNQLVMLLWTYPFDRFLVDGKAWVEQEPIEVLDAKGQPTDDVKFTNRNRSLRSFQAYLGLSYKLKESGDSLKKSFLGTGIVRSHLYMWAVDRICPESATFHTKTLKKLRAKHDELENLGTTGTDKITRLMFFTTRLLFKELNREKLQ
jgi:hypothetical protein